MIYDHPPYEENSLSSAALDHLRAYGYAVVQNALSHSEVLELRKAFDRLLALARAQGPTEHVICDANPFRLHRIVWCGALDRVLSEQGADPRFLSLAASALGSRNLVQIIQQAHYKIPGDEVHFPWHQDASNRRYGSSMWTDVDGRGSFVQLLLAIDPMTPDNGGLRVRPGTHGLGFVADPETGAIPPRILEDSPVRDLFLEPGDLVMFGPFLIHGSLPNRGTESRRTFIQGYALPGANRRMYPGCGQGIPRHAPGGKIPGIE